MAGAIDAYVDELGRALHGPERTKADLLREARDGLVDATAAHETAGLDRVDAERRAIADFGEVPVIAPGYQTELGLAQSRRTAWLMLLVVGMQPLLWQGWWPWFAALRSHEPGGAYLAVQAVVEWLGIAAILASLLAVLILGVGSRYVQAEPSLTRAVGVGAMLLCGALAVLGLVLTSLSPDQAFLAGLLWLMPFLLLPLAMVASAARRCLASL